jgi:hypothetical protein
MSMQELPFRANGHLAAVADGDLATVFALNEAKGGEALASYPDASLLDPFIPALGYARCGSCGESLALAVTGDAITVRDACPLPDGITTVITLDVPSGQLLVDDDLRPAYDWKDEDLTASYNTALGQAQAIEVMAAQGCAFGYVGNSCPGLYRTGESTYVIASPGYDEDTDKELIPEGWRKLAWIITDLWAYSIADYAGWQSKGGDPATLDWGHTVVDVPPGSYQFTHHTGKRSFDRDGDGAIIFADVKYLGNPAKRGDS